MNATPTDPAREAVLGQAWGLLQDLSAAELAAILAALAKYAGAKAPIGGAKPDPDSRHALKVVGLPGAEDDE